ncbi:tyrosine-type recombinase/integrase [Rhodococcus opacus]|uniref:Tyrosine-type recombinase/integrase n=1 Tax=Rhodococcus opacus TaxID=37919 RepID=A0AAX3YS25_RHOOP|nr:tyrosine-type recombinase/integrase [Rhodococcus opacus]MCZ4587721.1 tyrosine-type recombinase/integrase [Rhodococcus opacus]WLF51284.1 tyrosine-type recombinase/integrase [Rhodococcus opacus]
MTDRTAPLDVAFDNFMTWRKAGTMSPHTAEAYRHDFTGIAEALTADTGTPVETLTVDVLDKNHLRQAFARFAENRAPATVRRCWSTWNTMCSFWCTEDLLEANPMPTVLRPAMSKRQPSAFDPDAVARLIAAVGDPQDTHTRAWPERDLAIVLTTLLTGCRLSELVELDMRDLRAVEDDAGAKAVRLHGKGEKDRTVTIEVGLVEVLGHYLSSRAIRFPHTGRVRARADADPWARFRATDPLFVGPDGERITRSLVQYRIKRAYTRAGIDDQKVRGALVHQLRHTFATTLANRGVSVYELRQLLGHSSIQTTSRYTAAAGQDTREAAKANPVYRMLDRPPSTP